jgi:hypothetical protein
MDYLFLGFTGFWWKPTKQFKDTRFGMDYFGGIEFYIPQRFLVAIVQRRSKYQMDAPITEECGLVLFWFLIGSYSVSVHLIFRLRHHQTLVGFFR